MVFAAINSKHAKLGPWLLSMPQECEATIIQESFSVACVPWGKHPAVMTKIIITVARGKG